MPFTTVLGVEKRRHVGIQPVVGGPLPLDPRAVRRLERRLHSERSGLLADVLTATVTSLGE
ncbi:hypothetical protein FHP29_06230 [Nocardioides albidus]|uniref:Uncharacterized protein n=1 Tax=Nocardioides albidus TaxID=1517589 RepID=A0A5C4W543_9ACTN|nr:hypothetical protein FHP29_06230 [Nocardioides albidus]